MTSFWSTGVRQDLSRTMTLVMVAAALVQIASLASTQTFGFRGAVFTTAFLVVVSLFPTDSVRQVTVSVVDLAAFLLGLRALRSGSSCQAPAPSGQLAAVSISLAISICSVIGIRWFFGGGLRVRPVQSAFALCGALFASMSLALFMGESDVTGIALPGSGAFTLTVVIGSATCAIFLGLWPEFTAFVIGVGITVAGVFLALLVPSPCRPFGATAGVVIVLGICWAVANGTFTTMLRRSRHR